MLHIRKATLPDAGQAQVYRNLGIDLASYMHRHHCGDWGDLDDCDKQANEDALIHGDRILSHYKLAGGRRIYIITEAGRQSTCVLLPEEY